MFGQIGAIEEFWRNKPNWSPTAPEYVCTFNDQYGSPGVHLPHGWYYGLPWREERDGAPRDVYLKLDTIDYNALLQRHAPILKYDSGETFHVLSPGALTDFYIESGIYDWSNTLKDGVGDFAVANPAVLDSEAWELDRLRLDYLRPVYESTETLLHAARIRSPARATSSVREGAS